LHLTRVARGHFDESALLARKKRPFRLQTAFKKDARRPANPSLFLLNGKR
jgi:hypothetical protein